MDSIPLYRASDVRRIEAVARNQPLMDRAGQAAADLASTLCANRGGPVLILAGPGNNGGDAFVAARLLRERFFETHVVFIGETEKLPIDAANALQRFVESGGTTQPAIPENLQWALIIDGLFGIGLTREITGVYADLIRTAKTQAKIMDCPLLALDCPSGLNADTGTVLGTTIRASYTLTFIAGKPGLYTADGPDYCGEISVAPLDLVAEEIEKPVGRTIALDLFSEHLKPRLRNSHKGHYGNAGILGGASSMVGAALLAARAALRLGSGRVYVGLLDAQAPSLDILYPELMIRCAEHLLSTDLTALACGPGMGSSEIARELLATACTLDIPLVLDADALNLAAKNDDFKTALASRTAPTLLTPHPAEAARLLDTTVADIQADRIGSACKLARCFKAFVALKGCGTLVALPDGSWRINTSGNSGLATAGSGDVLTGLVTSLLAQGWPPLEALMSAVHLHGTVADQLVAQGIGPIGLNAGELIDSARYCYNQWITSRCEP